MKILIAYANHFSQNIGHEFTHRMIMLTAITGPATTEVGDHTSALVFGYLWKKQDYASTQDIKFFKDT
jgi:hypothetical protein